MKSLNLRTLLPLTIFLVLVILLWRGLNLDPHRLPSTLLNKPIPNFQLRTLNNPQQYLTQKDFLGHISLLHVWATWCATCQEEHPFLMDLAHTHKIPIYAFDYKDDPIAAKKWLAQYGDPYRTIGIDNDGLVSINWGVYGTPETFLIDQNGIIRYKVIGELTPEVWQKEIVPLVVTIRGSEISSSS